MTLKKHNKVREILVSGHNCMIILHKDFLDTPITLSTMELIDEEEQSVGYASINKLSEILGHLFKPNHVTNDYYAYRWNYDIGVNEHLNFIAYLESQGLFNIRNGDDFNFDIKKGFALCDGLTMKRLYNEYRQEEEI